MKINSRNIIILLFLLVAVLAVLSLNTSSSSKENFKGNTSSAERFYFKNKVPGISGIIPKHDYTLDSGFIYEFMKDKWHITNKMSSIKFNHVVKSKDDHYLEEKNNPKNQYPVG